MSVYESSEIITDEKQPGLIGFRFGPDGARREVWRSVEGFVSDIARYQSADEFTRVLMSFANTLTANGVDLAVIVQQHGIDYVLSRLPDWTTPLLTGLEADSGQ